MEEVNIIVIDRRSLSKCQEGIWMYVSELFFGPLGTSGKASALASVFTRKNQPVNSLVKVNCLREIEDQYSTKHVLKNKSMSESIKMY